METVGIETEKGRKSAREKELNEWLPITANRNSNWWYSAFHNVTAMVGAGVLGLPYGMSQLGWYLFLSLTFVQDCAMCFIIVHSFGSSHVYLTTESSSYIDLHAHKVI